MFILAAQRNKNIPVVMVQNFPLLTQRMNGVNGVPGFRGIFFVIRNSLSESDRESRWRFSRFGKDKKQRGEDMEFPKLRYGLEMMPVEHRGGQVVLLRDRRGYCSDCLLLSQPVARMLALMDGENSLLDLQAFYMRLTGQLLFMEHLEGILRALDEHLFLDNERFAEHAAAVTARYESDPVRRMRHAGQAYPQDPERLRLELGAFFAEENGGPGMPRTQADDRRAVGLVAPHIDIRAGGRCFAHAYKAAGDAVSPGTWIVLGTGHAPLENFFALTSKDFETPLGIVACDRDSCEFLRDAARTDVRAGEYFHHEEHTVEFQAIFLSYLQPGAKIVPLLCSFSHEHLRTSRDTIDHFAGLLGKLVRERSAGIIASVDFAHVGPRYGGGFQPDESTVRDHMASDLELIGDLGKCDAEEFMRKIALDGNARNVCGAAPLYVLARALEGYARGRLLNHDHAVVDGYGSFVTFASMIFHEVK